MQRVSPPRCGRKENRLHRRTTPDANHSNSHAALFPARGRSTARCRWASSARRDSASMTSARLRSARKQFATRRERTKRLLLATWAKPPPDRRLPQPCRGGRSPHKLRAPSKKTNAYRPETILRIHPQQDATTTVAAHPLPPALRTHPHTRRT